MLGRLDSFDDPGVRLLTPAARDRFVSAARSLTPSPAHDAVAFPAGAIDALPDELLACVFGHLVLAGFLGWRSPARSFSYRWVSVLLVCRRWTRVALGSPRLFRFLDLEVLKPATVQNWVRRTGSVPLFVWLPEDENPAVEAALVARRDVLEYVQRIAYQGRSRSAVDWCDHEKLQGVTDLLLRNDFALPGGPYRYPALSAFSSLRRLHLRGSLPKKMWGTGMFPSSLQILELHLDSLRDTDSDDDALSVLDVVTGLRNLDALRELVLATDWILEEPSPPADVVLPFTSLRSLSLILRESDFDAFLAFLPEFTQVLDVFSLCRHPRADLIGRETPDMMKTVLPLARARRGSFRRLLFDVVPGDVVLTLFDDCGRAFSVQVHEDHGAHYRRVLEEADGSTVTTVELEEHAFDEECPPEDRLGTLCLLEPLRVLRNATALRVGGHLGHLSRNLLLGLAGAIGRVLFPVDGFEEVSWPSLVSVDFSRLDGGTVGRMRLSSQTFLGIALLALKAKRPHLEPFALRRLDMSERYLDVLAGCVPVVVVDGACDRLPRPEPPSSHKPSFYDSFCSFLPCTGTDTPTDLTTSETECGSVVRRLTSSV